MHATITTCVTPPYILFRVSLSLNGDFIPNHGYVVISDIGSTDDTAFICNTNRFGNRTTYPGSTYFHSGGDWFAPDGTTVGNIGTDDVPGFERNRRPMKVILLRRTASDPPSEGIYYCVVEDDTFINQTVYVGLYNSGGGGICTCIYFICDTLLSPLNSQFQEML